MHKRITFIEKNNVNFDFKKQLLQIATTWR